MKAPFLKSVHHTSGHRLLYLLVEVTLIIDDLRLDFWTSMRSPGVSEGGNKSSQNRRQTFKQK